MSAETASSDAGRPFGRYRLVKLIGRSSRSMAWLARDPLEKGGGDCVILLPRAPAADAHELSAALARLKRAAKLQHASILAPYEVGVHERWAYQSFRWPVGAVTLTEYLSTRRPPPALEVTAWAVGVLEGLAHAHEVGVAHGDLGLHTLMMEVGGRVKVWGFGTQLPLTLGSKPADGHVGSPADLLAGRAVDGQVDAVCVGLLLHAWLAHAPVMGEADLPALCGRIESEIIRLPFSLPKAVPEALRAITNRATDRHAQRRYATAHSLHRALSGWLQSQLDGRGGALALLTDRMRRYGHLPARPGLAQRVSFVARMENQRVDVLADIMLLDPALSLELLRTVNSSQAGSSGRADTMTTVRRAIQLVGIAGLRRAGGALKAWPGPLSPVYADGLERGMHRALLAGLLAAEMVPAGLDAESALLAAQMQHLGWLLVLYHFPEEAEQIEMLVQEPPPAAGETRPVGMHEDAAAMAVLGVDLKAISAALAQEWRMEDVVQTSMRPMPLDRGIHAPQSVPEWLRVVASLANETLIALNLPLPLQGKALIGVAQRYLKVLGYSPDDLRRMAARAAQALKDAELPRDPKTGELIKSDADDESSPTGPSTVVDPQRGSLESGALAGGYLGEEATSQAL